MAIKAIVIVNNNLEYYKHTDNSSHFYNTYYGMIVKKQIPKFESTNYINILPYQKSFDILNDLTLIEKAFIAYAHLVMSIIKLRPSETGSTAFYHRI